MTVALTKANAVEYRQWAGNRVYAAERALPDRYWAPAAQSDLAAAYRACVGPDSVPLRWARGGGRGLFSWPSKAEPSGHVTLGTKAPLFMAYHEAAHVLCWPEDKAQHDRTGRSDAHGQRFVDAYLGVVEAHGSAGLLRALRVRFRWQGFVVDGVTPVR